MSKLSRHRAHAHASPPPSSERGETEKGPDPFVPGASLGPVGALVAAGAYAHELPAVEAAPIPPAAITRLQHARVEIYCGHNTVAIADIRSASAQLRRQSSPVPTEVFVSLDQAAWLARQNRFEQAELAIEAALNRIAASRHSS